MTPSKADIADALLVAVNALRKIADENETSLRKRHGGNEKPNCRVAAEDAIHEILLILDPEGAAMLEARQILESRGEAS